MPRANKDVAPDDEINNKTKIELENLNPKQKKSKPIVDKLEKKEKDKKEKKIITQKQLNTVNKLIDKIKEII
tara:strand:+ start:646 stop:861 length:216 start_codon:yes stop_codon:yes gene_type:complete